MNAGDDPAVQLAARTRLQARAASETAFMTQPPFPQSQVPSAGSAPQFIGGTTPPMNSPPVETIPLQERAATQFRADAQGRIDVVQIPPSSDEFQRLHYDEMRHKALALVALGQMLGDLASPADRILEALPERMEDASVDKLWSRANTLRRRHDAHVRAIENDLGPNPARLDDLVAANLGDLRRQLQRLRPRRTARARTRQRPARPSGSRSGAQGRRPRRADRARRERAAVAGDAGRARCAGRTGRRRDRRAQRHQRGSSGGTRAQDNGEFRQRIAASSLCADRETRRHDQGRKPVSRNTKSALVSIAPREPPVSVDRPSASNTHIGPRFPRSSSATPMR